MLGDAIKKIRINKGLGLNETAKKAGITGGYLSSIENNKKTNIGTDILRALADVLGVSIREFYNDDKDVSVNENIDNNLPALNNKDEKDIAKKLTETLDCLEGSQDGLMFDGEPIDEETKELLRISLENSMKLAKQIAKQKYTPNKYKK